MTNLQIASRLDAVNQRIEEACRQAKRPFSDVSLLAVSKTKPLSEVIEAYEAGQRVFAENYAQEAVDKCVNAPFKDVQWHFIGPLQSNKSRGIAEHYDWVHTIDRIKIAKRLNDQRPENMPPLNILIQVNISRDPAKSGVTIDHTSALAEQLAALPNLILRGLMAIPAADLSLEALSDQFLELKNQQLALIKHHSECTELSIGMSRDFDIAIKCGATMVRVGSDIFGART